MESYIFTDLAYETYKNLASHELRTREYRFGKNGAFGFFEMHIDTEEQATRYRRPRGSYLTVTSDRIWCLGIEETHALASALTELLVRLLRSAVRKKKPGISLLVAGLGNGAFAVDAVGPQTVSHLTATRHIQEGKAKGEAVFSLAAISPGVLAETGIETVEQIRAIAAEIGADAVIAVDSLAASHYERLGTTVQLSDAGICPGSGVGSAKRALTQESVGVPVIALGIPTVVDSATLICDALSRGGITALSPKLEAAVAERRGYFVCPKESDLITKSAALLLAEAIDGLGGIKPHMGAYSEA